MAEENSPRCKVMIQGEGYDAFSIGAAESDGTFTSFPHQDSYDTQTAVKSCCEYLNLVASQSDPATTGEGLLEAMKAQGMKLALISSRIIAFDGKTFLFHQNPMKIPSESVYAKLAAMLPKVGLPAKPIVAKAAEASGAVATRKTEVAEATPASRLVPQPKVRNIVTVVQGGGGQDQVAEQLMAMAKDPELMRTGLTKPIMVTSGKKGAAVRDLSGMTEEEIMDRDVDALTAGFAAPPVSEHRIAAPERAEIDTDPLDISLDEEVPATESETEVESEVEQPVAVPATQVAPRVVSGDEAEHLVKSSAPLSDLAQQALQTQRTVEQDDEVAQLGDDVFLGHSKVSREAGQLAAALEGSSETVSRAGRNCVVNRVSGAGRGGTRPKDLGRRKS